MIGVLYKTTKTESIQNLITYYTIKVNIYPRVYAQIYNHLLKFDFVYNYAIALKVHKIVFR